MNSREVAALALKLLGVYAIIQALSLLQYFGALAFVPQAVRGGIAIYAWAYFAALVPFLLVAIVAVVLLTQSETLAARIMKEEQAFVLPGSLTSRDIQAIAFSVTGVLVLLRGLPAICQLLVSLWYYSFPGAQAMDSRYIWRMLGTSGLSAIAECVLGGVLFFRSRGLANLWHRLQTARYMKIDDANPPESTERKEE